MLVSALCLSLALQTTPLHPTELNVEGAFKEPLSGIEFPIRKGEWTRARIFSYAEPPRLDHSVTYQIRHDVTSVTTATVYVFPNMAPVPDNVEVHLDSLLAELSRMGRGYELAKKLSYTFEKDGVRYMSLLALFAFRGGVGKSEEPRIEHLFLIRTESYWIKWRFSTIGPTEITRTASNQRLDQILNLIQDLLPPK